MVRVFHYYVLSETTALGSGAYWLVMALSCLLVFRGFQPHKNQPPPPAVVLDFFPTIDDYRSHSPVSIKPLPAKNFGRITHKKQYDHLFPVNRLRTNRSKEENTI